MSFNCFRSHFPSPKVNSRKCLYTAPKKTLDALNILYQIVQQKNLISKFKSQSKQLTNGPRESLSRPNTIVRFRFELAVQEELPHLIMHCFTNFIFRQINRLLDGHFRIFQHPTWCNHNFLKIIICRRETTIYVLISVRY